jgi:AraC-like DNA-binding protein
MRMPMALETHCFKIEYVESTVDTSVLWESHCHARFEMIGVLEGDVSVMIEGAEYRLTENQAILIPPLCYHTLNANRQECYRRITVLFDRNALPLPLISHFIPHAQTAVFLASHLEKIKEICLANNAPLYAPLANALITQSLYEWIEKKGSPEAPPTNNLLQPAIDYIDEHLHERICIDDLARMTSRSRSSFCHLFEEIMGITPKQYVLQKKMALANKMIEDGVSPTEAAAQLGYENYSSFYRIYVKQYGVMPKKAKKH